MAFVINMTKNSLKICIYETVAEFKEFERRFKFKPRLKSNVSRFKPAINLNRVLADLNRGSNSLNSISGSMNAWDQAVRQ